MILDLCFVIECLPTRGVRSGLPPAMTRLCVARMEGGSPPDARATTELCERSFPFTRCGFSFLLFPSLRGVGGWVF